MDDDGDPLIRSGAGTIKRRGTGAPWGWRRKCHALLLVVLVALGCAVYAAGAPFGAAGDAALPRSWHEYLTPTVIGVVVVLLIFSAFFSSCETAFLAIQKPQLRAMREDRKLSSRLVVGMLDDPGRLLTTILVGNMLVNTLIGVTLGTQIKDVFEFSLGVPAAGAYLTAVVLTTGALLFFGEITPKVFAVRAQASWARVAVYPLLAADWLLAPLRNGLLRLTDVLFRVTRFHELRAAPYITDLELKSMLSNGEAKGSTEEEGREMIRRILEFHDVHLREIVVPRLDVVAVAEDATVEEGLALFRENEYSRVPVFREDLDHITGILFAKDLLPSVMREDLDRQIKTLVRPAHFVPETMSVQDFIKNVQRQRSHLAIVVDEYGGTEGLVTLHDAIEQIVGDLRDETEPLPYEQVAERVYRVKGNMPLEELTELTDIPVEDAEHNTVAGFLMDKTEKVLEAGDRIHYAGIQFTVEAVERKRASLVRIELPERAENREDEP